MFFLLLVDGVRELRPGANPIRAGIRDEPCSVSSSASYWRVRHASVAGQDALEILHRQRVQFHADRQTPLQLGNEIRRFRQVERARRDEQHVIGLDHAVLGRHGRAFDERQKIALHALPRRRSAPCKPFAGGDLVDLVDEHDAVLLGRSERLLP